jgi:Leucine-rich repeat (LRR) protein
MLILNTKFAQKNGAWYSARNLKEGLSMYTQRFCTLCSWGLLLALLLSTSSVAQSVSIPDAGLEAALREALAKPTGDITQADLAGLTILDASVREIQSIEGLEFAVNLEELNLSRNPSFSVTPLAGLPLRILNLANVGPYTSDDYPVCGQIGEPYEPNLTPGVNDLAALANIQSLEVLNLAGVHPGGLTFLSDLANLRELDLSSNLLFDISPLAGLALEVLNLSSVYGCQMDDGGTAIYFQIIEDLSPLGEIPSLVSLDLKDSYPTDVSFLEPLTNLVALDLSLSQSYTDPQPIIHDQVTDISAVSGLASLEELRLARQRVQSLAPLAGHDQLRILDISYNIYFDHLAGTWTRAIADFGPLGNLQGLEELYLSHDLVSDLHWIASMPSLRFLALDGNMQYQACGTGVVAIPLLRDFSPLVALPQLEVLQLHDNLIHNVDWLQYLDGSTLQSLTLGGNPLGAEGVSAAIAVFESQGASVDWGTDYCWIREPFGSFYSEILNEQRECDQQLCSSPRTAHIADTEGGAADFHISLGELLRVIQLFNSGGYSCAPVGVETEDGYVPGTANQSGCEQHDSDYADGGNWAISLSELLRLVQFYNLDGYVQCDVANSEDGFCPVSVAIAD